REAGRAAGLRGDQAARLADHDCGRHGGGLHGAGDQVLAEASVLGVAGRRIGERIADADAVDGHVIGAGGEVEAEAGGDLIQGIAGRHERAVGAVEAGGDVEIRAPGGQILGAEAARAVGDQHPG
ncbi:MAG: hypothetical protein ACK55I_01810, partial [bacterium]